MLAVHCCTGASLVVWPRLTTSAAKRQQPVRVTRHTAQLKNAPWSVRKIRSSLTLSLFETKHTGRVDEGGRRIFGHSVRDDLRRAGGDLPACECYRLPVQPSGHHGSVPCNLRVYVQRGFAYPSWHMRSRLPVFRLLVPLLCVRPKLNGLLLCWTMVLRCPSVLPIVPCLLCILALWLAMVLRYPPVFACLSVLLSGLVIDNDDVTLSVTCSVLYFLVLLQLLPVVLLEWRNLVASAKPASVV